MLRSTPVIAAARETHTTDGGRCVDAHRALQHRHTGSLGALVFVTSLGLYYFSVGVFRFNVGWSFKVGVCVSPKAFLRRSQLELWVFSKHLEFQCWSSNVGVPMLEFQSLCLCFSKGFLEKITIGVVVFLKTLL